MSKELLELARSNTKRVEIRIDPATHEALVIYAGLYGHNGKQLARQFADADKALYFAKMNDLEVENLDDLLKWMLDRQLDAGEWAKLQRATHRTVKV